MPDRSPAFQSLVEEAIVGVYIVQDERFVYANPGLARMFGYTVDALLALPSVLMLVHEEDREAIRHQLQDRIEGRRETSTHAMRGRRATGEIVDAEVYSTRTMHGGRPAVAGTMIDVTERRRLERALEERERRYRDLVENASDVVFTCDLSGRITSLNLSGQRLTGYSWSEAAGQRLSALVVPEQREAAQALLDPAGTGVARADLEIRTRRGERLVLDVLCRLTSREGAPLEFQGIARDVTARKDAEQALRSLTIIDDLTQLYNRRGFLTLAERHLKLAVRRRRGVFLLFADLDGLKQINDRFGHLEGDRALRATAEILRRSFRSADIIARLGGDEFTVFPLEARDESGELLLQRLREQLDAYHAEHGERGYRLALSVGLARFEPDSSWSIDRLLEQADRALYDQKRRGQGAPRPPHVPPPGGPPTGGQDQEP